MNFQEDLDNQPDDSLLDIAVTMNIDVPSSCLSEIIEQGEIQPLKEQDFQEIQEIMHFSEPQCSDERIQVMDLMDLIFDL